MSTRVQPILEKHLDAVHQMATSHPEVLQKALRSADALGIDGVDALFTKLKSIEGGPTALLDDMAQSDELLEAIAKEPELINIWTKLDNAGVDEELRIDPNFLIRFKDFNIPSTSLDHADLGDFTFVPGTNAVSKMKGGGHGQRNIEFLDANNIEYNIVNEYENGVRVGNVPEHKSKFKRTGTGQSWFPDSWSPDDILDAGKYVGSLPENANLADGVAAFGNFRGVRVGIIMTNGKVGTIFPDSVQ